MLVVRDYECSKCKHIFELFTKKTAKQKEKCPKCEGTSKALVSAPNLDFTNMAMSDGCESALRRWELARVQKMKEETKNLAEHGTRENNLKAI